ncbi:MAG: hypothetical protein NTY53_16660 [Kiritimatiellaeota bacterium]|nr:hypothetical protein [Kiritimatiellota bacterium]
MKTNVLGTGQLGPAADYFQHASRLLQADKTLPGSIVCPATIFLAPDAVVQLLASGVNELLLATLAPLGTQPLRLQFCPAGDEADITAPLPAPVYFANQGTPAERAAGFAACVRGVVQHPEAVPAFIVTALTGVLQDHLFFPLISGTACASNPYAWSEYIDPHAGVTRLALGLDLPLRDGSGDTFARIAGLGAPQRRPEADFDDIAQHSQRYCFFLNIRTGQIECAEAPEVLEKLSARILELLTSSGPSVLAPMHGGVRALTFDRLLTRSHFVRDLQHLLQILSAGFNAPAEIAFITVGGVLNPARQSAGRPLPTVARSTTVTTELLFEAAGAAMRRSRRQALDHLIYVVPEIYAQLSLSNRFEVARLLGLLNRSLPAGRWALFGPGRWCTSSPEMGLPTTYAEISRATALVEIVEMHSGLTPDVSRGIHIFNELVATDMLYLAIFPGNPHNSLARERLMGAPNRLLELAPEATRWAEVVRVLDARTLGGATIELHADSRRQRAIAYATRKKVRRKAAEEQRT